MQSIPDCHAGNIRNRENRFSGLSTDLCLCHLTQNIQKLVHIKFSDTEDWKVCGLRVTENICVGSIWIFHSHELYYLLWEIFKLQSRKLSCVCTYLRTRLALFLSNKHNVSKQTRVSSIMCYSKFRKWLDFYMTIYFNVSRKILFIKL